MTQIHDGSQIPRVADKDPGDDAWYAVIWDEALEEGDSIASSEWILPAGLTQVMAFASQADTLDGVAYSHVNKVKISGGSVGNLYTVTNRVRLAATDQVFNKSFTFKVAKQ